MHDREWSWFKGCALGCGTLVALVVLLSAVGIFRVLRPMQSAVEARAELESRYGTERDFTPPADGAVDPTRLEAFLEVREGLSESCDHLRANTAAMARLEQLDREQSPSRLEVLRLAAGATRGAMRMGPLMGELFELRNELLLDQGMGLGEYTYLYVLAYQRQLSSDRPRTGILDGSPVNHRIHDALASMLERQLEAARTAGLDEGWIAQLEHEHDSMASDDDRVPWQDGLPEATRQSLAPYRDRLDATFCESATEVELLRNTRRTLAIESE